MIASRRERVQNTKIKSIRKHSIKNLIKFIRSILCARICEMHGKSERLKLNFSYFGGIILILIKLKAKFN